MLTRAILIYSLATCSTDAAAVKGKNFSVFFPADAESIFIRSGLFSRGAALNQPCSVGEGELKGEINDSEIREASGLAYSRRFEKVFSED